MLAFGLARVGLVREDGLVVVGRLGAGWAVVRGDGLVVLPGPLGVGAGA